MDFYLDTPIIIYQLYFSIVSAKYVGCFRDKQNSRDLDGTWSKDEKMTLELCAQRCDEKVRTRIIVKIISKLIQYYTVQSKKQSEKKNYLLRVNTLFSFLLSAQL